MLSNRIGGFFVVAGLGLATLVYAAAQAGTSDANCDGCVDLQDYAQLQGSFTGPGCTPQEIKSYIAENVAGNRLLVSSVPGGTGLVVTDVFFAGTSCKNLLVTERDPSSGNVELKIRLTDSDGHAFHWNSGVSFTAGMEIWVQPGTGLTCDSLMMSGYTH